MPIAPKQELALLLLSMVAASERTHATTTAHVTRTRGELRAALQTKLDALHEAAHFPGATLGIVLPDGARIALATGVSERESARPMQADDLMMQGSVGKTYVAALALQLVQSGRLDLNARVARYFARESWFEHLPNHAEITVRHLLQHTSGLMRYEFEPAFTDLLSRAPDKRWTPTELVAYVLDREAPFAAGHGFEYADTNYIVLGMILEQLLQQPLFAAIQERLLTPLVLTHTRPSDRRAIPGLVQGYAGSTNPFGGAERMLEGGVMVINPQFEWAGGGCASSALDLARWAKELYEGRLFDRALLDAMCVGVDAPLLGRDAQYGLGVIIRRTPLGTTLGHQGFFPGYLTEMRYYTEQRIAIAMQVNTSDAHALARPMGAMVQELVQIVIAHGG